MVDVKPILEAGRLLSEKRTLSPAVPHGLPFVILADGEGRERVEYLSMSQEFPAYATGKITLVDPESFVKWVGEFATDSTKLYADISKGTVVAIIDDHFRPQGDQVLAGWRELSATYAPKKSPEWQQWREISGKAFASPSEFGEWLQDHVQDVVEPAGAELMQIALSMRVKRDENWGTIERLSNGDVKFNYANSVTAEATVGDKKSVAIPEEITLSIPIYESIDPKKVEVKARLKFRLQGGVRVWIELDRPELHERAAMIEAFRQIREGVKAPIYVVG